MSDLTARIDNLLQEKGLRRADLVRACGIPEGTYRAWIRNGTCPKADDLYNIAVWLGVPFEYLLFGEAPETDEEKIPFDIARPSLKKMYEDLSENDKDAVRRIIDSLYKVSMEKAKNEAIVAKNVAKSHNNQ